VTDERAKEVDDVLERLALWGEHRRDVRALALVGSWAYGAPREDSDLDVVLLTESPQSYIDQDGWLTDLGGVRLTDPAQWGAVTERRFIMQSGLEIELSIGGTAWASIEPVDEGTLRVVSDGMRVLYDPEGILAALAAACLSA
jgi:hypothetical protein